MIQIPAAIAGLSLLAKFAWGAGIVATLIGAGLVYRASVWNDGHRAGYQRALDDIDAQDKGAVDASNRGRKPVRECFVAGGVWDTTRGTCIR
jgi:hypothetical protein